MLAWGDWVGRAATVFLVLLVLAAAARRWAPRLAATESAKSAAASLPPKIIVLPLAARVVAGLLRTFARANLLWMGAAVALGATAMQPNTFAQIRTFSALFLAPEAAAWCVLRAFAARASIEHGVFVLACGRQRLELALRDIAAVAPWRLPMPGPGASLRLTSGARWPYGLMLADPWGLARALQVADDDSSRASLLARSQAAVRHGRLDHPLVKFALLPLVLAIPAFRLHQHIAFGSSFGEYYSFGLAAYLKAFALWWAAWAMGVVLVAAVLRAAIEAGTLLAVLVRPRAAIEVRRWLERVGLALVYLGLPAWLLLRLLAQ